MDGDSSTDGMTDEEFEAHMNSLMEGLTEEDLTFIREEQKRKMQERLGDVKIEDYDLIVKYTSESSNMLENLSKIYFERFNEQFEPRCHHIGEFYDNETNRNLARDYLASVRREREHINRIYPQNGLAEIPDILATNPELRYE